MISFYSSTSLTHLNEGLSSEIALIKALERLNNAIQFVYGRPLTSLSLILLLPQGSWIYIRDSEIQFNLNLNINLYDPNKIILKINNDKIIYDNNKIIFNEIMLNEKINKITIKYISAEKILIEKVY